MRFGLVGTGYWARSAHAPALAAGRSDGIEFTSVWGRNARAAAGLAAAYDATGYQDFDSFLASVDAVDFAVPPDVQAPLATRAARAGKHLLLEKPIALAGPDADELAAAVSQAGVASVVFFTARFQAGVRAWLADVTHLILHHASGASAAVTVTLSVPENAALSRLELWGPAGRTAAPVETGQPIAPLRTALAELAASATTGQLDHPCDVHFGRAVLQVLADAQRQLDAPRAS